MHRTIAHTTVPLLAVSIILAACGRVDAEQPSSDPTPSAPPVASPSEEPSQPVPTPKPTAQPSEAPANPIVTPTPIAVVKHRLPMIGRVTDDGVAVRWLPDLESGIVNGNDEQLDLVESIRLRDGDEVLVLNGPVYADGISWYEVMAGSKGPAYFFRGFMAGESLERLADAPQLPGVATVDGQGFPASASASVAANTWLTVNHAVTPMPGDASCTFELSLVGTEGQRVVVVAERQISEATNGQVGPRVLESLVMEAEGQVTVDVTGDCSFAVAVTSY